MKTPIEKLTIKIIETIEELANVNWVGKNIFADLPLNEFMRHDTKGIFCSAKMSSEIETVITRLVIEIMRTVKEKKAPPKAVLLVPYIPDASWWYTLSKLNFPVCYFKSLLPMDSQMFFDFDDLTQEERRRELELPLNGELPYATALFYLGPEGNPWYNDAPPGTTFDFDETDFMASRKQEEADPE